MLALRHTTVVNLPGTDLVLIGESSFPSFPLDSDKILVRRSWQHPGRKRGEGSGKISVQDISILGVVEVLDTGHPVDPLT